MESTDNQMSLEQNFERLNIVIDKLEAEDISLEDAFAAYSEGMTILETCNEQIDRVEKKVLKLSAAGELEEF